MKKLVALLFAGFLSCSTVPKEKEEFLQIQQSSPPALMIMGFYEKGVIFIKDTDNDKKLDTKEYYEMIISTKPNATRDDLTNLFILKYDRKEVWIPNKNNFEFSAPELAKDKFHNRDLYTDVGLRN